MPSRTVQSRVRRLQRLTLVAVLVNAAVLPAQTPRVTSARLTERMSDRGVVEEGFMLLILRIEGLPGQRVRELRRAEVVIADSEKRTYAAEAVAIGASDSDDHPDRQWLFRVPSWVTAFELRLPTFAAVPFVARYSRTPRSMRESRPPNVGLR